MGFIDFLAYIKKLGKMSLVFFPSKTDLISVSDPNGNPTDEILSERLACSADELMAIKTRIEEIECALDRVAGICTIELKDITNANILSGFNVGAITDDNGAIIVQTDKIIPNTDGYSLEPGTIVYSGDTADAAEETVGYYKCIKKVTIQDVGELFDYTQNSFENLEYFTYLGRTSIGKDFYTVAGEQARTRELENEIADLKAVTYITLNLKDISEDMKTCFGYLGELTEDMVTASGSASFSYVMCSVRSGIVYVPTNFSVVTSVYSYNGAKLSFFAKAGYYKVNGGGVLGSASASGVSYIWEPLGTELKIQLKKE